MSLSEKKITEATCLTKRGRVFGWSPLVEADVMGSTYLGDYNARVEAGKNDAIAERLYGKAQFWQDRYNRLAGNS